ncbi:hypothetical protein [Salinibacter ruber]|uniref:hypothetical protein n=1 Tax=Salinibacter ruber TaxID=146919 RepID=UPI00216A478E|nr:hypothetical protein [Salinibacter ruber]MCS4185221.1 hypothetical protein [Salinibacter ruber]
MHLRRAKSLILLAACITFGLVACDSGGSTPPEEALRFPTEGNFGPNLLSGEIDTALASEEQTYSMRAEKVGDIDTVRLRIDVVGDSRSGQDYWALDLSSQAGWAAETLDRDSEEWSLLAETGDAKISFTGTDTLSLRVFIESDTEPIKRIRIPWE